MKTGLKTLILAVIICAPAYILLVVLFPEKINHSPEYLWPVLHHGAPRKMIPALAALLVIIAVIISFANRLQTPDSGKVKTWQIGIFLFLSGLALNVIPMSTHRMGILEFPLRIYVTDHTSYFTDAVRIKDTRKFLAEFPERALHLNTHSRTHPPLAVLGFRAMNRTVEALPAFASWYNRRVPRSAEAQDKFNLSPAEVAAGGVAAVVIIILAGLSAALAFMAGREFLTEKGAFLAAALFIFTPAYSHKTPVMDQVFGFLILLLIWLLLCGLRRKTWIAGLASGMITGLGLWLSPVFLAAIALGAILSAARLAKMKKDHADPPSYLFLLVFSALFAAGILASLLGAGALMGLDYLEVFNVNMKGWELNNTVSGRVTPWMWILFNPYEFFAWQGVTVFILVAAGMASEILRLRKKETQPESFLFWGIIIFAIALDLSGRVCYEAYRLTWFLIPFTCMIAANFLERGREARIGSVWALILIIQVLMILAFRLVF